MAAHAYAEDQLVKQPAIRLFAELGWRTVVGMAGVFALAARWAAKRAARWS